MPILTDQDIRLDRKRVREWGNDYCTKSYPLQIPMYHYLTMHVYQSPSDIFELSGIISLVRGIVSSRKKTYKLETVRIPTCLNKLIDVSIGHPF